MNSNFWKEFTKYAILNRELTMEFKYNGTGYTMKIYNRGKNVLMVSSSSAENCFNLAYTKLIQKKEDFVK